MPSPGHLLSLLDFLPCHFTKIAPLNVLWVAKSEDQFTVLVWLGPFTAFDTDEHTLLLEILPSLGFRTPSPAGFPPSWPLLLGLHLAWTPLHWSHPALRTSTTPLLYAYSLPWWSQSDWLSNIYTQMTPKLDLVLTFQTHTSNCSCVMLSWCPVSISTLTCPKLHS